MPADFLSLAERADALVDAGRRDEALAVAREAEAFDHDADDDLGVLRAWNKLGTVLFRLGYNEAAERAYAVVAAGQALAQDRDLEATVRNNLGQVYGRLGRLQEARAALSEALAIREQLNPDSRILAVALDNLGNIEQGCGDLEAAERLHRRAVEIFTRTDGYLAADTATAIGNLGRLYEERRQFERAEACRLRAFYSHLRAGGPLASETLLDAEQLCGLYLKQGRADDVGWLVEFLLSLGQRQASPGFRVLADTLDRLAEAAFVQHRLDLASRLVTRAVELLEASEGPDSVYTLKARFQRAATYRAIGNLDDAEAEYSALMHLYGRLDRPNDVLRTSIELAKTWRDKGGWGVARELVEGAIERLRGDEAGDPELLASALGNLAEIALHEDRHEEAQRLYASAIDTLADEGHVDWPWLAHGLATVHQHFGELDSALRLYGDARTRWIALHGAYHPFVATCAANLALVHWSAGKPRAALAEFRQAMTARDQDIRRLLVLGSERQRIETARGHQQDMSKVVSFCLAHGEDDPELRRFAAEAMLRRKSRVLDSMSLVHRFAHASASDAVRDLFERLLVVRSEVAQLGGPLAVRAPEGGARRLEELRREEEALETTLSHESALARADLAEVTLPAVEAALNERAVLIEFVRFNRFSPLRDGTAPWRGRCYAAMVLRPGRAPDWVDLGTAAPIDAGIDRLRRLIDRLAPVATIGKAAGQLAELVLAPLNRLLGGASDWLVAPDGMLALMPFDVLLDAWIGIERAPLVSFLVTGRDLVAAAEEQPHREMVIVAAPDFDADGAVTGDVVDDVRTIRPGERFAPLAHVLNEAKGISQLLPSARLITGPDATVASVKNLRSPHILHIATHGIFEPLATPEQTWSTELLPTLDGVAFVRKPERVTQDPMLRAGLVLSGANSGAAAAGGILTAREIAGMDLAGTEFVVLSACETGVGHIRDGEEFSGLRRAFAIAGARSQLTSLWAVDDAATATLMLTLYERLRNGASRVEALRDAQAAVRTSKDFPAWVHPFYWSAFTLSGQRGPLAERPD